MIQQSNRRVFLALGAAAASCSLVRPTLADQAAGPLSVDGVNSATFTSDVGEGDQPSALLIKAQILLDRNHASPGVIDGLAGDNMSKAISVFETLRAMPVDGKLTEAVWSGLSANTAAPVLKDYEITPEDTAGPFTPAIPIDYGELAKLPHLGYRNAEEMLAARFHMDQSLLSYLNPDADFSKAGQKIVVASVESTPPEGKIARIDVDKKKGQVRAYDERNKLIVAYPATVGSEELPSPSGTHEVKGVAWSPVYSYDPVKNFQQGHNTKKLTIASGPNNPVGSVFIALTKPTYGIHGSPDPTKIDKTVSHGCVRLTNWDAEQLAHMVRVGLPVHFL